MLVKFRWLNFREIIDLDNKLIVLEGLPFSKCLSCVKNSKKNNSKHIGTGGHYKVLMCAFGIDMTSDSIL